jgi:pimeloyl-ACP methyl ester carboxylesterase
MGKYDIPASINYVLNATGQEKLAAYFGYSLGVSAFFMGAIEHPQLNDKVEVMFGLGPTVSVAHLSNFFRFMAPFVKPYQVSSTHNAFNIFRTPRLCSVIEVCVSYTRVRPWLKESSCCNV